MPTKRSFAEFAADIEHKHKHPQRPGLAHTLTPTPPASTSRSTFSPAFPKHTAYIATPVQTSIHAIPSLLRRCVSLPTLSHLRQWTPFIPLTAENLRAMDPANPPMTPDKTVSGSRKSKSTTTPSTVADKGYKMSLVGLLDPTVGAERLEQRPQLHEAVMEIVGGSRASSVKLESAKQFNAALSKMATRNEATVASRLMPFLIKSERMVEAKDEDLLSGGESDRHILRSFELDHLDWSIDKEFSRASVPFPSTEEQSPLYFGIRNPKPDITYGFQRAAFNTSQLKGLGDFEPDISGPIVSPFFVVEWKGFHGSMQLGRDQARRSGAAMVNSRRMAMARLPAHPVDEISGIAFTCVINLEAAHIHVYWAEEGDEGTDWLMAVVKRFHMGDQEDLSKLRRALHNILDWGLTKRLNCVRAQLDTFLERLSDVDTRGGKRKRVG
ncbi:hypothetical protein DL98DRAFT_522912 [Cadophora sp. DSE1049]|nr:hypothetical protein DL98DRAFT_522912 [Cadophora sp. DSE1049]